jgi:hypothetical protein
MDTLYRPAVNTCATAAAQGPPAHQAVNGDIQAVSRKSSCRSAYAGQQLSGDEQHPHNSFACVMGDSRRNTNKGKQK